MLTIPKAIKSTVSAISQHVERTANESLAKSEVRNKVSKTDLRIWTELQHDDLDERIHKHITRTKKLSTEEQTAVDLWKAGE